MRGILAFVLAWPLAARADEPFTGAHAILGVELRGGPAVLIPPSFPPIPGVIPLPSGSERSSWGPSGIVAVRFGVLWGREEITLEVAPFTSMPYSSTSTPSPGSTPYPGIPRGPVFEGAASYAHYFSLWRGNAISIELPVRVSVGAFGGNDTTSVAYFSAAGSSGVALRAGSVLIDFRIPVFRYAASTRNPTIHLLSWQIGLSGSWIF